MILNAGGPISGSAGPQVTTYNSPGGGDDFGSIVVYNTSGTFVDVYVGQQGALGLPSFSVPPSVVATYPIPGAGVVTVKLRTYPTTGNVTVNLVDTVLSAASSILPGVVGGAGVFPAATQMQSAMAYGAVVPITTGSPVSLVPGVLGASIYVYSISVSAQNNTATAVAQIRLCAAGSIGGTQELWGCLAPVIVGSDYGSVNIAQSGGPLPLLVVPPYFYAGAYQAQYLGFLVGSVGTPATVSIGLFLNVTYAQF